MKGNFKKMLGKKFAKVMSVFLSCAIALSSFAPVAYATDGVETVSNQVRFNCAYDWDFSGDNHFIVSDKGTEEMGVTVSAAPAGYHYEFLIGSYDPTTGVIVPDSTNNGAVQATPADGSDTQYTLTFDGQKLIQLEKVKQNGYIFFATALVNDTTGEIASSQGFDVFVSVEEPEQSPVTHNISHEIYMGTGNMCEVPSVGTTADVTVGQVFVVRFFDNGEQIAIEKVTVSQEGLTAAGFEITNQCGCGHMDFRATEAAELGEATLYFTVTLDDGTVMWPEVVVNVVSDGEGSTTDSNISARWHLVGSNWAEYDLTNGMNAAVDVTGDTGFYIEMQKDGSVLVPTAFETGDTDYSGTDGISLREGHEGTAVFVSFSEGLTNGQKLVKITNAEGDFWFYFNVTGGTSGGEDQGDVTVELIYLGGLGDQSWRPYTGEAFEVWPRAYIGIRFKESNGAYVAAENVVANNLPEDIYSYTFTDGDGNDWNAIDFGWTEYGEYTIQHTLESGKTVDVNFVVGEQHYYGEKEPYTENTFTGSVKLILGSETDMTDSYHGTQQGSWTGVRFYTPDGEPIDYDKVTVESFSGDFSLYTTTSDEGYDYWDLEAHSDAKKGYHTVRFNVEGYGVYTLVLYVNEASGGGSGSDFPAHYYGSLDAALNDNADTFSGYMNALTGPNDNPDVRFIENNFFGSGRGSMFGVEFWVYDEVEGKEVQLTLADIGIDFISDHLEIRTDENSVYGGIDIWVDENAMNGYHVVMFDINGAKQPLVVGVMSGSGPGSDAVEDTFTGSVLIAPQVNADGTVFESPIPWWNYNEMGDMSGNCFRMSSDNIFGVKFLDENGEVISPENVEMVTPDHSLMEMAGLPYDYKVFYLGDRWFIGEKELTFKINNQYKTIRVVSEYAVVTEWQNPVEDRVTHVVFDNYDGYFSREFTEEHGTVVVCLEGNNLLYCDTGSPVIKTAGDLMFAAGGGDLTINFAGAADRGIAIQAGGSLTVEGQFENHRAITVNDIGTVTEVDGESVTKYYGADVIVGAGHTNIWCSDITIDGDFIVHNAVGENWYEEVHAEQSTITADTIYVNGGITATFYTKVNARTVRAGRGVHAAIGGEFNLTGEAEERVGISAGSIDIINGKINVDGGMPMYHDNLGFMAAVYAADEICIEFVPDFEGDNTEALLNVTTDVEQAYAVAARNLYVFDGSLNINSTGSNTTALYTYGNAEGYDYGVAVHSGNVNIVSNGNGIWSDKDIQLGNRDYGNSTFVDVTANGGYAAAVDPTVGGQILFETEGISLYGSEGAVAARYYPINTEEGVYGFNYNENIWVKAGTDAEDASVVFDYEDMLDCTYVCTAEPDEDAKVEIAFDTNGGDYAVKSITKVVGNYYGTLPVPVKMGHKFIGWTEDAAGNDFVYHDTRVKESVTLYAQWQEGDADTLYLDGVDTDNYIIPEDEYYFVSNWFENLNVEFTGDNDISMPGNVFTGHTISFNGADDAVLKLSSDSEYAAVVMTYDKLTFNGRVNIVGKVTSYGGVEFNNCEVEIDYDGTEYALMSHTWNNYQANGDIVVNKGAIVLVIAPNGTAVIADGANVVVNAGGTLGAQGKNYGVEATKSSSTDNGGKITVVKGGSLVAMGNKAAMKAENYSLVTAKKMVAGFIDATAKVVKAYSGERFFSIGDYAEAGTEVITDMVVNGEWFNSKEEYWGNGFYYAPNTTFNGEEGKNVLYFEDFCFTEYSDIDGIKTFIFAPEDVVITSAETADGYTATTDTDCDCDDEVNYIYSLGDVHISNVYTGEPYLDARAENFTVDNDICFRVNNLDVNKNLTVKLAELDVNGVLEVKGDAHFEGTNRINDNVYIASEFNWSTSEIYGDLKVLGTTLDTANNLRVHGDMLVSSGTVSAKSYNDYSQANIMVGGTVTVGNSAELYIDHMTAGDVVVGDSGAIYALRVNADNVTVNENGYITTSVASGYSSLNVNSKLNVYGGDVDVIGGIETYELNITDGTVTVTDAANGIDLGKMNMSGGTVNIGVNEWYDFENSDYNVSTHGIILRSYGSTSAINITGGELNVRAGEYAIYITKGRKATINTSAKKYEAKACLEGGRAAVYTGGTLTAYGDLTAAYWYDGLEPVTKYNGERYLFVNVKTHYNVTFHYNSNNWDDYVEKVRLNDTAYSVYAEKPGFTFTGWFTDSECTQLYDFTTPVTSDFDLYAGWVSHKYTLNANGGTFVMGDKVADSYVVNVPYYGLVEDYLMPTPSRANCIFTGWYTDAECTVPYQYGVEAEGDKDLYAGWTYKYTVSEVVATIVPADADRTQFNVVYAPADGSEVTEEYFNTGIKLGDRIVLKTSTENAVIIYALVNTDQELEEDSYRVYTGPIEITKDLLTENGIEADNGEIADILGLFVYATKADYNNSNKRMAFITVDADRDEWGNVLEEDRANFSDALDVPDYMWVANVPAEVEYTGTAVKADDMRVYDNKTLLVLNQDYTVTYASNTNAGTAKIIIRGKGNYADTLEKTFTITPMEIDGTAEGTSTFEAQLNAEVKTYNKGVQKPTVKFVKDGKALVNNKDYTVTFEMYDETTGEWTAVAGPKEVGQYRVVITGKGNYSGVVYENYRITANVLADKFTVTGIKPANYTGEAVVQPGMVVKCSGKTLVEGVDYDAFYSDNVSVGKATIAIVARVNSGYEGVKFVTFDIKGTKLTAAMLKGFAAKVDYNGGEHTQEGMYLVNKNVTMIEGTDYTVAYENNTAAGTATMTVTGIGGYTGTVTKTFTIGTKLALSMLKDFKATLKYSEAVDGNGYVEQPADRLEYVVKVDGVNTTVVLEKDIDYTVTYANNDKAGKATAVYEGIGAYYGTFSKTFTVAATPFTAKAVKAENWADTVTFTGEAVEQSGYELYFDGVLLTEGVDYTVTYKNNVKAGTATVAFKGMTGYSGTYNKTFKINKVKADSLAVDMPEYVEYTKGGTTPEPVITYGDVVLAKGTDYTVTYKNHTKPGQATAAVKFKGNYEGELKFDYTISVSDIENATITIADVVFKNKAGNYTVTPKLVDKNGKALVAGTDFVKPTVYYYAEDVQLANGVVRHQGDEVGAKDIVPAGTTICVVIEGKGYYTSLVTASFRVVQTSVASAAVTIEAQNYTGKPVELDKNQITVKAGGVELDYNDYEIIGYENNTKIGTAKVTIKGIGSYGGTKTVTFKIQAKSAKTVIKFMPNGGTGNVASVNVMNDDVTLTSIFNKAGKQTINRTGYVFVGWNTEKDGSGVHYDNEGTFLASDRGNARTIRLYAQWAPVTPE